MQYDRYKIGTSLKRLREGKKYTQEKFCDMTGIGISTLQKIECGIRGLTMQNLFICMQVLGVDANTLLGIDTSEILGEEISCDNLSVDKRLLKIDATKRNYLLNTFVYMLDSAEQLTS